MRRRAAPEPLSGTNPIPGSDFPDPTLRPDHDIGVFLLQSDQSWQLVRKFKASPTAFRVARNKALVMVRRVRCLVRVAAMPLHLLDPSPVLCEYDTR